MTGTQWTIGNGAAFLKFEIQIFEVNLIYKVIHKRWLITVTQLVYFTIIPLCDTIVTLWHASCDRCDIDESHFSDFFRENFRDSKSVKISVFVVWSECQFNVRNVYFEKSKFSKKKKIKNSDTKKLKKKSFKKFVCLPPSDKQLAIKFQFRAYARFS